MRLNWAEWAAESARRPQQSLAVLRKTLGAVAARAVRLVDNAGPMTEVHTDHEALQRSEARYRLAFENAPIGIVEDTATQAGLRVAQANRAIQQMLGVCPGRLADNPVDDAFRVVDGEPLSVLLEGIEDIEGGVSVDSRLLRSDGSEFWAMIHAAALPDDGIEAGVVCQVVDVTDARDAHLALEQRAFRDPLTGLPNRRVVLERLDAMVDSAAGSGHTGALLFCDLDNFKAINDEHGHLVGDRVLGELASRLGMAIRSGDVAGRFGGDEFIVISYPITPGAARGLGDRVSERLSQPIVVDPRLTLTVRVSIGIAIITGAVDPVEALRRADAAMYAARARRNRPTSVVDTA